MNPLLSVVIPTRNPDRDSLTAVLAALRQQSLSEAAWELIVVDNGSSTSLDSTDQLDGHRRWRVVREDTIGLTHARMRGFTEARGEVIVLVDDDNVLDAGYLEEALSIGRGAAYLGAWGGIIRPRYEDARLAPPQTLHSLLTLRDAAEDSWSNDPAHHASTPWGAGLCVRASVARQYIEELESSELRRSLDLSGSRLLYGGDTDITYTACRMGLGKGVFRSLTLEHLIPATRCSAEYLCRVAEGRGYSEILHHVALHGALPHETTSLSARLLRGYRRLRLPPLERQVMAAHDRGRRQALRELSGQVQA